jgi:diguanylate cyclase (GGDEF)-like protein
MPPPQIISEEPKQIVLIIDDSKDVHRLVKARLRQEDLEFISAESGPEGIQLAGERQPAIILLDLDMPEMDGYEVLRALKDSKLTRDIPVIILSGLQGAHDKVTAFDLGAIDYVTKPFDLAELRARVRSSLRLNQLVRMLAQRAQIDGLTGLWNRAAFDRRWSEEYARSARHGHPLALALVDIDHFKSINDTFGHPAGDAVLIGLAKLLVRELRSSDVACRYGGEEFALIMPDTSPDAAMQTCERLRVALESLTWPRHPERKVTMSIGCVGADRVPSVSAERWIELVDQALYAGKRGGRNRVTASNLDETLSVKMAS